VPLKEIVRHTGHRANGVARDKSAVHAAITQPWSNGQVEAQITKLKLVKMTGWAASGTGKAILATGAWAPLSGKTDKWTAKPTGAAQFTVEQKFD
jgi:hypothetical protein